MLLRALRFWLTFVGLLPGVALAQLTITNPVPRMVFQRDQFNEATIIVAGLAPSTATTVEARLVPLAVGQGTATVWKNLAFLPDSKAFRGLLTATAGWYRLDVRAKAGSTLLTETKVNRIGIGEVFVVAGQSNMVGGFEREPGAEEDRVSCVDFRQNNLDEQLLPLMFNHISYGASTGPSQPPHIWGRLGDRLVRRLNVPVLFLGAAQAGTSSDQWRQSAAGATDASGQPFPYRRLSVAFRHYVARTGARAVLWHQGEGDVGSSGTQYFNNIQYVIQKTRQQLEFDQLPWLVSRVTYTQGQTNPGVIAAQNRLIAEVNDVFAGPSTDDLTGPDNRLDDNVHFGGNGLIRFVDRWDKSLNDDFFARSVPYCPIDESSLLTTGYTLPLTRRPGETVQSASLRAAPAEADNQYFVQLLRASDNTLVTESARGTANPMALTLPGNLPDGQYRLRTLTTHPVTTGTLGEPFKVDYFAASTPPGNPTLPPVNGGLADGNIVRLGYRYENESHSFYAMVQADVSVEVRLERIDGGPFSDVSWHEAPPSYAAPDYTDFADYNYIRNYPPLAGGIGGVEPGRYRLSVRRKGDTSSGFWFETTLQSGRTTLFQRMETVPALPPVINITSLTPATPCIGSPFSVAFEVTESAVAPGNTFTVQLSDEDGYFDDANPTVIGSGMSSPVTATLPSSTTASKHYRLRVAASNPAVVSAPSASLTVCSVSSTQADLSLTMHFNKRTPAIGQVVSCTITLTNNGPQDAAEVVARNLLPVGLSYVDTQAPEVSAADGVVTINAGTVANGASRRFVFRVKATQAGTFATSAQITGSNKKDPDSQPGSGTGDGQDDAITVDLRTTDRNGPLITSANPNQTPLPDVQDNQPPTDPAKADLSLGLSVNKQIVRANDIVTVSVQVNNRGGAQANSATIQTLLPNGWQLTSTSGLTVQGQTVTGSVGIVPVKGSATLTLQIRVGGSGTLKSQISATPIADTDSTPGNGYTAGEDDEGALSLRIR
ncbi:DUF11 domain-containing protein [Spirosoma taeanense]|uniref:DUF11 domain-containing protein n=1 Tax=Spirosoma taeanense TaxID=2735870 RepID=A0A6M5Y2J8_9BACT|nr:sialate O-acetylesterase [Spirosoma taeanense]QJW88868.1 DUF11 domain-containing protein [Spirosoma taeanense]